jgi:hypothetical protein
MSKTLGVNLSSRSSIENDGVEIIALTEFTLFPKLATELRYQIWEFALPGPRTITISVRRCSENQAEGERRASHLIAAITAPRQVARVSSQPHDCTLVTRAAISSLKDTSGHFSSPRAMGRGSTGIAIDFILRRRDHSDYAVEDGIKGFLCNLYRIMSSAGRRISDISQLGEIILMSRR